MTFIDVLRLNGLLVTAGDRMVARLGLTSTRWQVLRAIYDAERDQPVAWLARDMGGNRQNVQRIVNDLQKMGLVTLEVNPHHRRASLVVLTDRGRRTYDEAGRLQAPWANALSEDLAIKDIDTTRRVVAELRKRLELNGEPASTQGVVTPNDCLKPASGMSGRAPDDITVHAFSPPTSPSTAARVPPCS